MANRIRAIKTKTLKEMVFPDPAYRLAALPVETSGYAGWRNRAASWMWRKLSEWGALKQAMDVREIETVIDFDPDAIVEQIFQQRDEMWKLNDGEPVLIIMGCEDLAELSGTPNIHSMMQFRSDMALRNRAQFIGVDVVVSPWMRGVAVLGKPERDAFFEAMR